MIDIISGVCSDDPGGVRPVSGAGCSGANRGRTTYTDEQVRESGGGVRLGESDRILGGLGWLQFLQCFPEFIYAEVIPRSSFQLSRAGASM